MKNDTYIAIHAYTQASERVSPTAPARCRRAVRTAAQSRSTGGTVAFQRSAWTCITAVARTYLVPISVYTAGAQFVLFTG